ncbi:MAG: 16S rRNA processing protein RimM [Acidocella sp. 20-57-95]|nr:MAG: 16S rRNA processing protein RimM [Acidocella sp. 20-57-95]OYV62240.1 MAG: 16S rRNA processing protein RimM [Acidocella sp. 21-58-7]HQT62967.1 ribosome maturation factor RimM [Acidocella sp.]HQU04973.1 ribosome maturation factor RimM [Acidocella sp.]
MGERLVLMGVIGKPHGVRGLVRVHAYTEAPSALADYAPLTDRAGRQFALDWVSEGVAQLSEISGKTRRKITDRNEAEKLVNTELFVPRSALPAADEEEFYLADLIGMVALGADRKPLGTVAAVHDYGGGTSLEIMPGALLVPFTKEAVPEVNIADGHIVVVPPHEVVVAP